MNIFLATPSYDGNFAGSYMESREALSFLCMQQGHELHKARLWYESLVTRARDRLLQMALCTNATHIVWIDADIGFRAHDILRMCNASVPFVVGAYPKKNDPKAGAEYVISEAIGGSDSEGLVPVRYAGTGCMVWKREVAEKLVEDVKLEAYKIDSRYPQWCYPVFKTPIIGGVLYSEDYHVCWRWRQLGGDVFHDPETKLTHKGGYTWGTLI